MSLCVYIFIVAYIASYIYFRLACLDAIKYIINACVCMCVGVVCVDVCCISRYRILYFYFCWLTKVLCCSLIVSLNLCSLH